MAVSLAPATEAALQEGRVSVRSLLAFDLPSGIYGFHSGLGPFPYNGITFIGAGSLISIDAVRQGSDLEAIALEVTLTSVPNTALTPDVLATIEDQAYHQRPCSLMTAYLDADTYVLLSVETEWRGYVDQISQEENAGGEALLRCRLESRFLDIARSGYRIRSDVDQQALYPGDDGLKYVSSVHTDTILFGRTPQLPQVPQKKSFLQRLFG